MARVELTWSQHEKLDKLANYTPEPKVVGAVRNQTGVLVPLIEMDGARFELGRRGNLIAR